MSETGESKEVVERDPLPLDTPAPRGSPWVPLAILAFVIVAGSAIWMLTH